MGLKRKFAGGVAAMSASVLPFALDVPGAAADDHANAGRGFDHSFPNSAGVTVTCHVDGFSDLFRQTGDPTYDAFSSTGTGGTGCSASVTVSARYTNPSGLARESSAFGDNFVTVFNDDVAANYVATHSLFFHNCADNCFVSFQTSPK
jgi:hypothetical protein